MKTDTLTIVLIVGLCLLWLQVFVIGTFASESNSRLPTYNDAFFLALDSTPLLLALLAVDIYLVNSEGDRPKEAEK